MKSSHKFLYQDLKLPRESSINFFQDFRLSSLNFAVFLNSMKARSKTQIFFLYLCTGLMSRTPFFSLSFWTPEFCSLDCTVAQFRWERQGVTARTHPSGRKRCWDVGTVCSQLYTLMGKSNSHLSLPKLHPQLLIFPPE